MHISLKGCGQAIRWDYGVWSKKVGVLFYMVFFLGKKPLFFIMKKFMDWMWSNLKLCDITLNDQAMFLFKVKESSDMLSFIYV